MIILIQKKQLTPTKKIFGYTYKHPNFSGVRPVASFAGSSSGTSGPVLAPGAGYSRESTPDSGGSHYMDAYRDPSGKRFISFFYFHSYNIDNIYKINWNFY